MEEEFVTFIDEHLYCQMLDSGLVTRGLSVIARHICTINKLIFHIKVFKIICCSYSLLFLIFQAKRFCPIMSRVWTIVISGLAILEVRKKIFYGRMNEMKKFINEFSFVLLKFLLWLMIVMSCVCLTYMCRLIAYLNLSGLLSNSCLLWDRGFKISLVACVFQRVNFYVVKFVRRVHSRSLFVAPRTTKILAYNDEY